MRLRPLLLLLIAACDPAASEPDPADLDVPALELCDPVADWDSLAVEDHLVAQINALRRDGGRCGARSFLPAAPLGIDPALRCIARLHSKDMVVRGYLAQVDPDGVGTGPRLDAVGYLAATFAEDVAFVDAPSTADADLAEAAADAAVRSWKDNPTTCWKLYAREWTDLGVGAVRGGYDPKDSEAVVGVYWTATFAAQ